MKKIHVQFTVNVFGVASAGDVQYLDLGRAHFHIAQGSAVQVDVDADGEVVKVYEPEPVKAPAPPKPKVPEPEPEVEAEAEAEAELEDLTIAELKALGGKGKTKAKLVASLRSE